jgi:hypothetical protein
MKKLVVLFLAITFFAGVSLMGCSQEAPPPPKPAEEAKPADAAPAPAPAPAPATPAPEKPAAK